LTEQLQAALREAEAERDRAAAAQLGAEQQAADLADAQAALQQAAAEVEEVTQVCVCPCASACTCALSSCSHVACLYAILLRACATGDGARVLHQSGSALCLSRSRKLKAPPHRRGSAAQGRLRAWLVRVLACYKGSCFVVWPLRSCTCGTLKLRVCLHVRVRIHCLPLTTPPSARAALACLPACQCFCSGACFVLSYLKQPGRFSISQIYVSACFVLCPKRPGRF